MAAEQGIAPEVLAAIVPAVIGAVFGGAVFGDHCSPYSDTTIVSALATGVSTHEHTITQLPYALVTAGAALGLGYFPVALGVPGWLAALSGGGILTALVILWVRRSRVS
jgi:Na+/H+ antiporter NhaC